MRRWTIAGACVGTICCLAGTCIQAEPPAGGDDSPPPKDDLTLRAIAGLEHFSQKGCAACHCNEAAGGCNLDAPNIQGVTFAQLDAALRREQVLRPHPFKWSATDEEIEEVEAFLDSLSLSTPIEGNSQITLGYSLYVTGGCISCHLASAQGVNQGGTGAPIAGTNPDNIYAALSGQVPCHPRQREVPEEIRPDCRFEIASNDVVKALTDTPPPDADNERILLSHFLAFISPPPSGGFVEPCEGRSGEICTAVGNGTSGFTQDNVPATETLVYSPTELSITDWNADGVLDLAIVDWNNHRIRVVYLDTVTEGVLNRIESIAGTGKVTGDDALNHPTDLAFDAAGALVMANWHNQNIYRYARGLARGGDRDHLAGLCDLRCSSDADGPTRVDQTYLALPTSLAIHPDGRVFFSEAGCNRIRVLTVGSGAIRQQPSQCITPVNLYPDGRIETLAGAAGMNGYAGDGGPARDAIFNIDSTPLHPNFGIAFSPEDPPARLYVCDTRNHCIRAINLLDDPPTIELVAGVPTTSGYADGPAAAALFNFPTYLYVHADGVLYVADTRNHAVRRLDPLTGQVTTVAGTGVRGFNGDNIPATQALLNEPYGVVVHPDGRIFIGDTGNNRVRVVNP